MIAVYLYLVTLLIAPQLWVGPVMGWPSDYICFPLILIAVAISGRLPGLLRWQAVDALLLAFVLWITVGAIAKGWTLESQAQVFFYWKILVLFKLLVAAIGDTLRVQRATTFFCALVLILAVEAIQHRFGVDGRGWAGQTLGWIDPDALAAGEKGRARWIGIFGGPGVFAVLFPMAVAFPLCALGGQESRVRRWFLVAAIVLLMFALYCTGSRGGMVAMLAVIVLYVMLRADFSLRAMAISAGIAGLVYLIAPGYLTTIRDQSNSSQYRVEMWAAGLDMIKEYPVLGVGIANFRLYTGRLIGHNSAVEIMGETGVIGLILWLSMLYVSAKGLLVRRAESTDQPERWYLTAMLLALVGYIVSAMFVTLEYETLYILLAWCAVLNRDVHVPVGFSRGDLFNVGKIAFVWVVFLQAFVIVYLG